MSMTRKQRFEAAIRCEEVDRLPFWVKVFGGSYRQFQAPKFRDMPELELADLLQLEHMAGGPVPVRCRNAKVAERSERHNGTRVTHIETPDGAMRMASGFDAGSHSWHPIEFPIKNRNDLLAMRHRYAHRQYEFDADLLDKAHARIQQVGDRGIVHCGMAASPFMDLIQHLIGPENTYYFMQDYPDEFDELVGVMHQERLRHLRLIVEHAPYDYVVSVENTSTTLMSPAVFERYPCRHLREYAEIITAAGKTHILHQCGTLKALLPKINELPSKCIEAYSSPPVGDTTLADRAQLAPDTSIIGGTCATLWLRPLESICEQLERDFDEAGGIRGVVLTSAGVMPPACPIEKIAKVGEFCRSLTWDRFSSN